MGQSVPQGVGTADWGPGAITSAGRINTQCRQRSRVVVNRFLHLRAEVKLKEWPSSLNIRSRLVQKS